MTAWERLQLLVGGLGDSGRSDISEHVDDLFSGGFRRVASLRVILVGTNVLYTPRRPQGQAPRALRGLAQAHP